jgi:hypothetical protein
MAAGRSQRQPATSSAEMSWFFPSQLTTIATGSISLAFFLWLAGYAYYRGAGERRIVLGALLISLASLNTLIRGLFPGLSPPSPTTFARFLPLANGLLALAGGVMLEREWRKR